MSIPEQCRTARVHLLHGIKNPGCEQSRMADFYGVDHCQKQRQCSIFMTSLITACDWTSQERQLEHFNWQ
jgi:hypothetical protein